MAVIDMKGIEARRKCNGGFLQDYVHYAGYLEGPGDFNTWVGISLIGMTMGRRCWVRLGFDQVYPNLYTVLVGPSAVGKGMAMSAGRRVLYKALGDHGVPTLAQKTTPEALVEHLKEITEEDADRGALIWSPEFSNLIGRSKYDQALIQDLTDYYDCLDRKVYRTRTHGEEVLTNLCVNLLAASTPEWLKSSMPEDSIGGGFLSRLLIINRLSRNRREARPTITKSQETALDNCVNDLQIINKLHGEYRLNEQAYLMYANWYEEYLDQEIAEAGPNLESYYERKKLLMLKLGMIARASADDSKTIKVEDIEFAIQILGDNEKYLKSVVRDMGMGESGKQLKRVKNLIRNKGTLTRSKLLQRISLTADELNPLIETLLETKEIERVRGGVNQRQTSYKWVTDKEFLEESIKTKPTKEKPKEVRERRHK